MPTKLVIDYSEGTFCCHASWIYGTHVRKVPMEEPVECDYDNYDTIYIVIDTTTDKSYHFKNKYQASEYMDENSYMLECQVNDRIIPSSNKNYTDRDNKIMEVITDSNIDEGDTIYVCQFRHKEKFDISTNESYFTENEDDYELRSLRELVVY